jgi:zinc and cadmium transporter
VSILVWIILFCIMGGVLSVLVAGIFLLLNEVSRRRVMPPLISFATGALLGAAFLAILPHAFSAGADIHYVSAVVLAGIMGFFLLEKLVLWRHYHGERGTGEDIHMEAARDTVPGIMVLVGDSLHNLMDGVLISAAFLTDIHLGVVTAVAVTAHEIPQEVGDFVLLLHSGFSRSKALLFNVLSSLTTVIGGVAAYASLSDTEKAVPYVLAVAAASFIYIAIADLIPTLHRHTQLRVTLQQLAMITLGIVLIGGTDAALH